MATINPVADLIQVDLGVTGMTCTSCSARVERKLNKLDGVDATVNYATESATISYDPAKVEPDVLIDTVRGWVGGLGQNTPPLFFPCRSVHTLPAGSACGRNWWYFV